MKTIAVLTSGGDAPGMNAAVRAVVRTACVNGIRVLGVIRGYNGLINGDFVELDLRSVSDIIHRGGTKLYSARSAEFATEEGMRKAIRTCRENGIEGVVVIGGDGSFRGARDLSERGIPCVGIPGTIDNDIACCDYTIGYDTCLNTIMECVDKVRDTTESHDRCTVIEVMGRRAGYLALNAGIAVGATSILIPEIKFDIQKDVIERMKRTQRTDKKHFLIVVAEGATSACQVAEKIKKSLGLDPRVTILGHVQRGGNPNARDRVTASRMGYWAVKCLADGKTNRVVVHQNGEITDVDMVEALKTPHQLPIGEQEVLSALTGAKI